VVPFPGFRSYVSESPADDDFKSPLRDYDEDGRTPHARTFSVSSETDHPATIPPIPSDHLTAPSARRSTSRHRPLQLTLPKSTASSSTSPSPNRSPDSYLPTPDESVSSTDEELYREISESLAHTRTVSYSSIREREPLRVNVLAKKSLPDLRPPAKLRILEDSGRFPPLAESPVLSDFTSYARRVDVNLSGIPSPVSNRQDSADSDASFGIARPPKYFGKEPSVSISPTNMDRPAPPMDNERNSYFRRYSTIQPSSLQKIIPEPLLHIIDAVRGILFAVSQIYQALQHYTVFAIDDRLSSVLLKVLDPASAYMAQLINALDRFDSMSRRSTPTPAVCRTVIECCRDNVAAFGKAVGVLSLQLKVLASRDDDRYTRQMLLVLYGASAEISNAWQSIVPNMRAVEPFLRDLRPTLTKKARSHTLPSITSPNSATGVEDEFGPLQPPKPPFATQRPVRPGASQGGHIARRHAGSFSTKDVEIGKTLPSVITSSTLQAGVARATETPTPRAALRQAGYFPSSAASSASASPVLAPASVQNLTNGKALNSASVMKDGYSWTGSTLQHSRQSSQSSLVASTCSSPSTPSRMVVTIPEPLSTPTPANVSTVMDKPAIDAMVKAVHFASPIWNTIERLMNASEDEGIVVESSEELRELLGKAKFATTRLTSGIESLHAGLEVDRKVMRDTAHWFVKVRSSNEFVDISCLLTCTSDGYSTVEYD
jgi:hypothetical protein